MPEWPPTLEFTIFFILWLELWCMAATMYVLWREKNDRLLQIKI
jgi:hypothetical protein